MTLTVFSCGGMMYCNDVYLLLAISFLENYGWFLLFGLIFVYVVWKRVEPKYRRWEQKRRETEEFLNTG